MKTRHKQPERILELETLAVLAAFSLIINISTGHRAFIWLALACLLTSLFVKSLARVITRLWMQFGVFIGAFNNRLILTAVYFIVLTPVALLSRLFTRNPLIIKPDRGRNSYYYDRNHTFTRSDLKKLW